jgi:hypothetical protein
VVGEIDVLTSQGALQYKDGVSSAAAIIDQLQNKTIPFLQTPAATLVGNSAGAPQRVIDRVVGGATRNGYLVTNNFDTIVGLFKP